MKNNRKRTIRNTILGSMLSAGVAATTLGFTLDAFKTKDNFSKPINVLADASSNVYSPAPSATGLEQFKARTGNLAPSTIYALRPIDDAQAKWTDLSSTGIKEANDVIRGLTNLGINAEIMKQYYTRLLNAYIGQVGSGALLNLNGADFNTQFAEATAFFTGIDKVDEQFKKINQFNTSNNELSIFLPTNVYDVNEVGKVLGDSTAPQTALDTATAKYDSLKNKVEYIVAKIDQGKLKDKDVILDYLIKDNSQADKDQHEYHILIKNNKNSLVDALNNGKTLQDLVNSRDIIIRDVKKAYDPASSNVSTADIANKFKFDYDSTKKMISIIASPKANENIDANTALTFKAANDDTIKNTALLGFIDTNLAPYHEPEKQLAAQPQQYPLYSAGAVSAQVFAGSSLPKITNSPDEESLTFYMAADESMTFDLQFKGDSSNAVWSGDHSVQLTFDGSDVKSKNHSISLTKGVTQSNAKFGWDYTIDTINGIDYAKVTVKADGNEITFNSNDKKPLSDTSKSFSPIVLQDFSSKIFFEPVTTTNTRPGGSSSVAIRETTDVTDKYKQYLQSIYANWFNVLDAKTEDQGAWILMPVKDTDADRDERVFDFDYSFFYLNEHGGVVKNTETKNGALSHVADYKRLLLVHDVAQQDDATAGHVPTFAPTHDATGELNTEIASGQNAAHLLSEYYRLLSTWLSTKLGITGSSVKGADYYDASVDPTKIGTFIETHILANSARAKTDLINHANALITLAWKGRSEIVPGSEEDKYITSLEDSSKPALGIQGITSLLDGKIKTTNAGAMLWDAAGIYANQLIMKILEEDMTKVVAEILTNENKSFESYYSALLGNAMKQYLTGNGEYKAISPVALTKISDDKVSDNFKGQGLVALNGEASATATTGKEQLKSLLDFISNFNLQNKYLDPSEAQKFDLFYRDQTLLKEDTYVSTTEKGKVGEMIGVIDNIVSKMIGQGDAGLKTLKDMVNDIQEAVQPMDVNSHADKNTQAANEIKATLDSLIDKITRSSSSTIKYEILSQEYSTSYLQNLVMGRNLAIVRDKWVSIHKDAKAVERITQKDTYDPKALASIAISMGYYNFEHFIRMLTDGSKVPSSADEILNKDWEKAVNFEIPKSNSIINFMSNPGKMVEYGTMAAGVLMSLIGASSYLITLNKASKKHAVSKKSSISMKLIFGAMSVIGLAVAAVGFLL